jgi:hypothetical protein
MWLINICKKVQDLFILYRYMKFRYFIVYLWGKYWLALSITLFLYWLMVKIAWEIIK